MQPQVPIRPQPKPSRPGRRVVGYAILAGLVVAGLNYDWFIDEYAVATYQPPADIAALVQPLGLTDAGRALLARSKPQLDDKAAFNRDCQTQVGELELGCYASGRIYILRITSDSLKPEMETVLAHELMHAAWSRLRGGEREHLGTALEQLYSQQHDNDLSARMAGYAKSEPGEETNELHSILGTELPQLNSGMLDSHYQRYFKARPTIVAAHQAYEAVFATRGKQLEQQLATIKSLKAQLGTMNARLETYRANNQIAAYNSLVPGQNRLVDQINGLIDVYDRGVDEYNALSASIDSHQLSTEPGV